MPLQNRVTPEGEIITTPARGLYMGNRGGQIHRRDRTLTGRRWMSRAWITCLLEWRGRREVIMADRHYTQLFFLDEATALAAGHRPCALCRRQDYLRFATLWTAVVGVPRRPRAAEIDALLHAERLTETGGKRTFKAPLADLPDGTFVRAEGRLALVTAGRLLPWRPEGYDRPTDRALATVVVLTPPTTVAVLKAGYRPFIHPTAARL